MAKKRKGAKRGSSASRSRPSEPKVKRPRPVSPVPKKRAPKRGRTTTSRSVAARKGWETRRRENPLRWGSKAIAKRRQKLKRVDSSAAAIEKEWRWIERKALKQKAEADAAPGGVHPEIAKKLVKWEKMQGKIDEMKTMIRTFNNEYPDQWEMEAYNLLEKFITFRDSGVASSDQMKEAHQAWYQAKLIAREKSPDWPAWMAMIGSVLGLPMHGDFSVDSFVTS